MKSIFINLALIGASVTSFSQGKVFATDKAVALNGYDLVAYYNQYDAVRGSNEYSTTVEGTIYYFSSAENLSVFKTNPSAYLPAYGGYCAFAVAMKGAKVPSDPHTFKIRDGKLYFFFNDFYEGKPFNTIIPWNGSETAMITKANANWKSL